jgi:hypothetical protein
MRVCHLQNEHGNDWKAMGTVKNGKNDRTLPFQSGTLAQREYDSPQRAHQFLPLHVATSICSVSFCLALVGDTIDGYHEALGINSGQ